MMYKGEIEWIDRVGIEFVRLEKVTTVDFNCVKETLRNVFEQMSRSKSLFNNIPVMHRFRVICYKYLTNSSLPAIIYYYVY